MSRNELINRLSTWGNGIRQIEGKRRTIDSIQAALEDDALLPKGRKLDGMPSASRSGSMDSVGRVVAVREGMMEQIEALRADILEIWVSMFPIDSAVMELPDKLEQVIMLHYQQKKSLSGDIPEILNVSPDTVRKWHGSALDRLRVLLDDPL